MQCPDCGKLIRPGTPACPGCGYPFAQRAPASSVIDSTPDSRATPQPKRTVGPMESDVEGKPAERRRPQPSPEEQYQADPFAFVAAPNGDVIVPLSLSGHKEASSEPGPSSRTRPGRRRLKLAWMRKLIVPAVAVLILWFALRPQPLTYHVASIDPQFGISETQVESILQDAAERWNVALKKTAIRIDTRTGGNAISFVFDYRQQYQKSVASIDSQYSFLEPTNAAIVQEQSSLEWEKARLEGELASLNNDVAYWKSMGGATRPTNESLVARGKAYNSDVEAYNRRTASLNQKVVDYNARFGEYKNALALAEKQFKLAGGSTTENAVGIYDPSDRSITVYSYADPQDLRLILMHELGHALGCGHTNTPGSIMYPEFTSAVSVANPVPTAQDLELVGDN